MTCWFQGAQTPRSSACGVLADLADCRLHYHMGFPCLTCNHVLIFLRCDLQVRIFEDFEDEQCGSPGFFDDSGPPFHPKKSTANPAEVLLFDHGAMSWRGFCWSGQMMGLARNGGWEASYLVSLGVGQGVFKCSSWACSMDPLDCSICSWHIELSMEMTCQIRKLSHSSRSNLATLSHISMKSANDTDATWYIYIYIYTHNIYALFVKISDTPQKFLACWTPWRRLAELDGVVAAWCEAQGGETKSCLSVATLGQGIDLCGGIICRQGFLSKGRGTCWCVPFTLCDIQMLWHPLEMSSAMQIFAIPCVWHMSV